MDQHIAQHYRLAIGLAQGIFLYLLYEAFHLKTWPATDGYVFAALLAIGFFAPLVAISGVGNLRSRTLFIWLAVVVPLCGLLGFYDIFRIPYQGWGSATPTIVPVFAAPALAGILFIAHTLIVAAESDNRLMASYSRHFDVAWKHAVQIALSALFVGVLWAILFLGAWLFELVQIKFIRALIVKPLFWIPITAVSFAYALQLTDTRTDLVRGARTLLLMLMSWLLPVMTAFATAFIAALPFTGLEPLWKTGFATGALLISCASLIVLINAAYQDGKSAGPQILRYFRLLASVILVPLAGLAAYGLMLRVAQYGWSPLRVVSGACVIVASWYAAGYFYAAVRSRLPLQLLEPVNLSAGFVIAAVLFCLSTPIADPVRISVNSQLVRLTSGNVKPENFDYDFLRFRSGRYGSEALRELAARSDGSPDIAKNAKQALARRLPEMRPAISVPLSAEMRLANISVFYPKEHIFPREFIEQDWPHSSRRRLPLCLTRQQSKCEAAFVDLDDDGQEEILLFQPSGSAWVAATVFKRGIDNRWAFFGNLNNVHCLRSRDTSADTKVETVRPPLKDIQISGQRMQVVAHCAPKPSTP